MMKVDDHIFIVFKKCLEESCVDEINTRAIFHRDW